MAEDNLNTENDIDHLLNDGDEPQDKIGDDQFNDSLAQQAEILIKLLQNDKVTDIVNKLKDQNNKDQGIESPTLKTTSPSKEENEVDEYLNELTKEVTQTEKRGPPRKRKNSKNYSRYGLWKS